MMILKLVYIIPIVVCIVCILSGEDTPQLHRRPFGPQRLLGLLNRRRTYKDVVKLPSYCWFDFEVAKLPIVQSLH